MYQARCLCGDIVLEVSAFEPRVAHCHCLMCQKFHGAAFSTFIEVQQKNLTWLQGKNKLASYQADNNSIRQFCQNCGSSLTFESQYNRQDKTLEVSLSLFDQPIDIMTKEGIHPDCHIFTESKAPWLTLDDSLPKYDKYRT